MSKLKTNDYVYHSKKQEETSHGSHKKLYVMLAALVVFLLLLVVLVWVENKMANKLVVNNKSSHDIEELRFWYEDANGEGVDIMAFEDVSSKTERQESTENLALSELVGDAWLSVYIKFKDGGEAIVQTGQFLYGFDGKISFEIADTKGEDLIIRLKAGEGLFNSAVGTGCDAVYYINPKNGYIE